MTEQRLVDLEVKISHHEATIEALQTSLYEQQKQVDRLEKSFGRLIKRLETAVDGGPELGPADEKPPHY